VQRWAPGPTVSRRAVTGSPSPTPQRPALVWEKPARAAEGVVEAAVDDVVLPAQASLRTAGPASTPISRSTSAEIAAAPQQLREALRTHLLDGVFTERLTDDVVRRVEKRLRIERERRGL